MSTDGTQILAAGAAGKPRTSVPEPPGRAARPAANTEAATRKGAERTAAPAVRYNRKDRAAAICGRREAVLFLISRGYSFKATGYAVGRTGEFARQIFARAARKVEARA